MSYPLSASTLARSVAVALTVLFAACGGCGPDENNETNNTNGTNGTIPTGPVEALPPAPLDVSSAWGCALDIDCAAGSFCFQGACVYECDLETPCEGGDFVCSARGQCLSPDQLTEVDSNPGEQALEHATGNEGAVADYYDRVNIVETTDPEVLVSNPDDPITVSLVLNEAVPAEGMPYRIRRTDDAEDENRLRRTEGDTNTVTFELAVGNADPSLEESTTVIAEIFTPVGKFAVALVPAYPISGSYVGTAKLQTFGGVGVPIEFEILTSPPEATLASATKAWLVLPVGRDRIFSPISPSVNPGVEHVAAPIQQDPDFTDIRYAEFFYEFELEKDDIWDTNGARVTRSMRFEIESGPKGEVRGSFSDQWTGLYEAVSATGVRSLTPVEALGELTLMRVGDARPIGEIVMEPSFPSEDAQPHAKPGLDSCIAAPDVLALCNGISTTTQFVNATGEEKATCAITVGEELLASDTTTGAQIRGFLDGSNMTGQSFEEFLQDCAAGTNGVCQPSQEIACSRELLARSYYELDFDNSTQFDAVLETYLAVARESYLGRQMAAFATDLNLRLTWLETTDYPAIVTNAVQDLNEQLLDEWRENVLDVHVSVLTGQFDPAGLSVMARTTNSAEALDARQRLILEMTQSWRGAMDSMILATDRWNALLQSEVDRDEKAALVSTQMFKLYVSANALRTVSQSANAGFATAGFGSGFSTLVRQLQTLSQGFDERIYARDGEVVINTSLDPEASTDNLLAAREMAALEEIDEARTAITTVLAEARAEALSEEQLRNEMNNQIDDLRAELVELCGLPAGCSVDDWSNEEPGCFVRIEAGQCGFEVDPMTDKLLDYGFNQANVSEAAVALQGFVTASNSLDTANADFDALVQRLALELAELETFRAEIDRWQDRRQETYDSIVDTIDQQEAYRKMTIDSTLETIKLREATAQEFLRGTKADYARWGQMQTDNATTTTALLTRAYSKRQAARELGFAGDTIAAVADVAATHVPDDSMGALGAAIRGQIVTAGFVAQLGFGIASLNKEAAADDLELAAASLDALTSAELTNLEYQGDLGTLVYQEEIDTLQDQIAENAQLTDQEVERLQNVIIELRESLELELASERDEADFRQMRSAHYQTLTEVGGLELRVQQAELQINQQLLNYARVVQTAELRQSKLDELLRQRDNINQLLGSPGAIFARANELERAERKLDQAKDLLMDWLVALEYYAVRPFMDQRLQIILARNTYQLEEIADEMTRLQRDCGGPTNELTTRLSVRDDLLGLNRSVVDPVTGTELEPADRFLSILERGYVPVDKRVRYRTDGTIGGLLAGDSEILAATFFIDTGDFANLELTCNAKVRTVNVNIVGAVGEGRPTVTLLYDGTSKLLSCQPDIDDYVAQFGVGATTFGRVTQLRTAGRSMSPVASVNASDDVMSDGNGSFAGLPLATQYTVLIDTSAGENSDFDWDALEDIEIELTYTYQDVFPDGQCE